MIPVLLTIDTELWPRSRGWPAVPLTRGKDVSLEAAVYFDGGGSAGPGLAYILRTLAAHDLKATFFIEPLFSYALGMKLLREIVCRVGEARHEVGLHLHPEWLNDLPDGMLPAFQGPFLSRFSGPEQLALIKAGLDRLGEAGVSPVQVFRAGSYAADASTLAVLRKVGIRFDSSFNACSRVSFPSLRGKDRYLKPFQLEGVWEIPVSCFDAFPDPRRRPLQVAACSFDEMRVVLDRAEASGWHSVVIVLHSFEFVHVERIKYGGLPAPRRTVMRRFEQLCHYLSANTDRFVSSHFADLDLGISILRLEPQAIQSPARLTIARHCEQLVSRVY